MSGTFAARDDQVEPPLPETSTLTVSGFASAVDPAVYCALTYLEKGLRPPAQQQIAINVRAMPADYPGGSEADRIDLLTTDLVAKLASQYRDYSVLLTPHHYFWFGGDDRYFLNKIKFALDAENVTVQNRPLSLRQTMDVFAASSFTMVFGNSLMKNSLAIFFSISCCSLRLKSISHSFLPVRSARLFPRQLQTAGGHGVPSDFRGAAC